MIFSVRHESTQAYSALHIGGEFLCKFFFYLFVQVESFFFAERIERNVKTAKSTQLMLFINSLQIIHKLFFYI